ncbi:diguanylate cyclase domain-containing protein [Chitiniphilus eburneus]|uniref:Diguanylate cyclase n=1 Tax=Chitiniphilus eburneus TaxID=2571148 RepID=A0A4U0Q1P0_9NEIS|nr:diguanylate cyclase [Chitiniphilus eburneus]TJZ74835.1 diguanylate cyclase [Chitiniphilus eburneus]
MQVANELAPLPRILVVDDSRIVRATVKKHLGDQFDVVEAADGEAGWQKLLADADIQLLLSDLTMPELDGLGLLARVRAAGEPRLRQLPIIIISGEEDEATRLHCVECGASDFVTKSTDRAEMLARVRANIERAANLQALESSRTEAARSATHHPATGAGTQHLLTLQTEQALAFARRHQSDVTVVLIEIDHFQALSDKLGARVVEQMLGLLTKHLAVKLRREDTLALVEGARFAVVSPGTTLTEARVLAERLRQTIANARINFRGEQLQVTASLAVANSREDANEDAAALITSASDRLYATPGENRVVAPDDMPIAPAPTLGEALLMLHNGQIDALRPHLPGLMAVLAPLITLANDELQLGWSLDSLPRQH